MILDNVEGNHDFYIELRMDDLAGLLSMTNNRIYSLRNKIFDVFPKNDPLPCIYLTAHRCGECDALRDNFCEQKWWLVKDCLVDNNYDKLPLFTSVAYHYYLPAFLLRSLDNFNDDSLVLQFVIYSLGPPGATANDRIVRERLSFFSPEQCSIIINFLESVLNNEEMAYEHPDAERALNEFWRNKDNQNNLPDEYS